MAMPPSGTLEPELTKSPPGTEAEHRLTSKELALISLFSATWIASQLTFGPIIGRISLGPFTLHGVVNRVVGWTLMLVLAEISGRFGPVSLMSITASVGTRIIRASPLSGFVTGIGYALGGVLFDYLFNVSEKWVNRGSSSGRLFMFSFLSGAIAIFPYLLYRLLVLGWAGFLILTPVYAYSAFKGIVFSLLGTSLGISVSGRVTEMFSR